MFTFFFVPLVYFSYNIALKYHTFNVLPAFRNPFIDRSLSSKSIYTEAAYFELIYLYTFYPIFYIGILKNSENMVTQYSIQFLITNKEF